MRASGGPSRSVTRAGIKRDGGKASGSVAGVPLGSGTRALPTRTPPPPAGPCGPQCPALSVAAAVCSGHRVCAGLCAPEKFQHPGAVGRVGGGGRSCHSTQDAARHLDSLLKSHPLPGEAWQEGRQPFPQFLVIPGLPLWTLGLFCPLL